jgi:hypothetical protein
MPLATFHSADQHRKDGMGGACGTYGRGGTVHRVFGSGNLREKRNLGRRESRWADDNDLQQKGRQGVGSLIWLGTRINGGLL